MINDTTAQLAVTRTVHDVRQYVSWYRQKQLKLRPPFQRKSVWKTKAKSFLIDTILRGLPIPIVILRDAGGISFEPKKEVVDGQQRLTTILTYILPEDFEVGNRFTISRSHLPEYANKKFSDLPEHAQKAILDYEISTHVLPSSVDDKQVLRIFSRLNATGSPLVGQELRNASYHGAFKEFVFELGLNYLDYWRAWRLFTNDEFARMQETEYVSTLLLRTIKGISGTSQIQLNNYYESNDDDFPIEIECRRRFDAVLMTIDANIGNDLGRTEFSKKTWFYSLFGYLHDLMFEAPIEDSISHQLSKNPMDVDPALWPRVFDASRILRDPSGLAPEVVRTIRGSTTNINSRKAREDMLSRLLNASTGN